MRFPHPWPARLLLGFALAAVAPLCLAPATAHAECGDYVILGRQSMAGTHEGHEAEARSSYSEGRPTTPSGQSPCSGPSCRRGPFRFPLAPVSPAPVRDQEWGHVSNPPTVNSPGLGMLAFPASPVHPARRVNLVYHPPRLS
jgi:hypothetical protein